MLTDRQERFCREYLIDGNATAAYRRAGYKDATSHASRLVANGSIQARLAELRAEQTKRLQIKADDILSEALLVAKSDVGDILDFSGDTPRLRVPSAIPEKARRAISAVKVRRYTEGKGDAAREVEVTEFRLWDKLSALDKLMRHLGLLKEQVELSGPGGSPIQTESSGDASLTDAIDRLAAAFEGVADRAGAGCVPGDGASQPVDTGRGAGPAHQVADGPQAG